MMSYDTPEFLAAEAAQKAEQLVDIRMREHYSREKFTRRRFRGDGDGGVTLTIRPLYSADWSENHEA